jgi:molybdopterin-binding protein
MASFQALDPKLALQLLGIGASKPQLLWLLCKEARLPLLAAVIAGFGGVISEVGASMMVGGNIRGQTRVLTMATVLETGKGNFELAIALSLILLALTFAINFLLDVFDGEHATIKTHAAMIHAKARLEVGTKVVACIRPDEVSLTLPSCAARDSNRLKGKVVAVSAGMTHHRVSLDCDGPSLVALVERKGYPAELALCEGHELAAVFSPDAVHLIRGDERH